MNLLVFDSSTSVGCVAVYSDGAVRAELTLSVRRTHSEHLMPAVAEVMRLADLEPSDLAAIGVGIGPGSYTGIRIAVGTALGFGYALDLPVIGVSSLEIVAMSVWPSAKRVMALQAARKDEVYCGLYQCLDHPPYLQADRDIQVARVTELGSMVPGEEVLLVGEGAVAHRTALTESLGERMYFAPTQSAHPQAASLAILTEAKLGQGAKSQAFDLKPLYIRRPYVD